MRLIRLVLFGMGLAFVSPAVADPLYDRCTAKGSTSMDFLDCGNALEKREEANLAAAWRQTYSSLGTAQAKSALLQEQRNWIKFKDSSCGFFATDEFGSIGWSLDAPACRAAVIDDRIRQLQLYTKKMGN